MGFASAHQEGATVADRIGLLFALSGTGLGGQARGIFHEQWHALFPAGLVSLAIALSWKPLRGVGKGLGLGLLATAAWWLLLTHCQSRFLLPAAVPLAMAIGLGVGRLVQWWTEGLEPNFQRLAMIVVGALPLVLGASSTRLFLSQRPAPGGMRGYPNLLLTEGTARRTGEHVVADFSKMAQTDRDEVVKVLDYEPLINLMIPESKVYLIGAATPLYLTGNVMYHTTWDKSALGKAIRTAREQPQLWSESLRALGVEYVLIDYAELSRLGSEGWQEAELNPEAVFAWASKYCEPVRLWFAPQGPEDGRAAAPVRGLYRLSRPAGPGGRTL